MVLGVEIGSGIGLISASIVNWVVTGAATGAGRVWAAIGMGIGSAADAVGMVLYQIRVPRATLRTTIRTDWAMAVFM